MSHTNARVLQWLVILLLIALFGGAYWYWSVRGATRINSGQNSVLTSGLAGYWPLDGADISGTTVYDRSGNGKNGTTSAISLGDGADGAVTITAAKNINADTIAGGRSYADGIAYRVIAPADSATSVTRYSGSVTLSNGIASGDEVLLINLQGASGDTADVGDYEIMTVSSVAADAITFTGAISKSFDGTTASNQKVVIQRIPNYTDVTLSGSGSLTASAWDGLATVPAGTAGYYTGIVALKASGTVSIASGTSINVNGKGYRGGAGGNASNGTGVQGESYAGTGTNSTSANLGAGGGGSPGYGGDPPGDGGAGGSYGAAASNATGGALAGSAYGSVSLTQIFFGSGAGGGGASDNAAQPGGTGGNGGGIVFISAGTVTVSGGISVNGAQGAGGGDTPSSNLDGGPGGGGAGGSIFIVGSTIDAGSSLTTSTGAAYTGGFNNLPAYNSTAGAVGRIEFEKRNAGSFSGIASPVANEGISGPVSGSGKIGQALSFDGTDDYISVGNVGSVNSVSFWIKADNTTKKILDLNGTAYVEVVSGTITATGWTSPTIYVDGAVSSTIDTEWHHVTITTASTITASAVNIGKVSTGYFDGKLDDVRMYSRVITAGEVTQLYALGTPATVNASQNSVLTSGLAGQWSFDGKDIATPTPITATGGTITTDGDYTIHTFTSSGTFTVTSGSGNVEYLVVAGGGGAGGDNSGGGGAGGLLYSSSYAVTPGAVTVTVGSGGAGATTGDGTNGNNSVFSSLTAIGGGGGGGRSRNGIAGGSGGGGGASTLQTGGSGTSGQGNAGGNSDPNYLPRAAGGGGGAGAVGINAPSSTVAGNGGTGLQYSISGTPAYYAGGGGGGAEGSGAVAGSGGAGGGGAGSASGAGTSGTANTGGGGGGPSGSGAGGAGGSGIVIVRYLTIAPNIANDTSGNGKNGTLTGTTRTLGKIGQALSFDGTDDYISIGDVGSGMKSVSFWLKADNTTKKILDLNGSAYVEVSSGTITATGWTSPTIYVDGVVASTIDTDWHHVVITTASTITASAVDIGRVGSGYFDGKLDDVRMYSRVITAGEVSQLYSLGTPATVNASQNSVLTSGLAGQWSFDGADISGTPTPITATGGTITTDGDYKIHTFTSSGTLTVTSGSGNVEVLVIAGGGSGGGSTAGGGGAGGLVYDSAYPVTAQAYAITVGAGGAQTPQQTVGNNGSNSVFGNITAIGGGGGGNTNASGGGTAGKNGGSGGGGAYYSSAGGYAAGTGTSGQGNNGGSYSAVNANLPGGGGGGSGAVGSVSTASKSGNGGAGLQYSISGTPTYYAGGGGGGGVVGGDGGSGGGGAGGYPAGIAGTANTGGGGGGGFDYAGGIGGAGGSGIVIVRYLNIDSIASDTSGNGKNGTLTNGPTATIGKVGQALDFDGTNDYIVVGNVGSVNSISFWIKTDNTTKKIIDLNGTAYAEVSSGTITATGWTSPTIYVDGAVASTIDTNWHHVVITSATGITASAVDIGRVSTGYFDGKLDDVRMYSRVLSASEIQTLYRGN